MSVEGISTSRVDSTPNYSPIQSSGALSNYSQGKQDKRGQDFDSTLKHTTQSGDTLNLSHEAQSELRKLEQRDREVRTHEQAHVAAAGQYVLGGINYTYTRGPDNKQYATGGSVSLDTSAVSGDPDATIKKAQIVRRAALAPANPSAQDQGVAAAASNMEAQARTEKTQEQGEGANPTQSSFAASVDVASVVRAYEQVTYGASLNMLGLNNTTFTSNQASFSSHSGNSAPTQKHIDSALAAYKTQQRSAFISSALAPWGTGISLQT